MGSLVNDFRILLLHGWNTDFHSCFFHFFRVDKSRSRELGGVGLGLALVREIVKVHDGIITIQPNPAGGMIFEVVFARQNFLDKQDHKQ